MKKTLFVADKIDKLKDIMGILSTKNDVGIIAPSMMSYSFIYNTRIAPNSFPLVDLEPNYKNEFRAYGMHNLIYNNDKHKELDIFKNLFDISKSITLKENKYIDNDLINARKNIINYIKKFDEIHCVSDTNISGIRGFMFYFEEYLGIKDLKKEKSFPKITFLNFSFFSEEDIIIDFKKRKEIFTSDFFTGQIDAYKKKDFFNFNFTNNSIKCINEIFNKMNIIQKKEFTNNMLQTLLLFENESNKVNNNKFSSGNLFQKRLDMNIASHHTSHEIELCLSELGLINMLPYDFVHVTKNGHLFLSYLHPSMKDSKLAIELAEDTYNYDMDLLKFKEKYNKKIYNMFKKQKL